MCKILIERDFVRNSIHKYYESNLGKYKGVLRRFLNKDKKR